MTHEDRFERIERGLEAVVASQLRTQEMLSGLVASVTGYVDASNAHMTRLEENLDGLIRAITAEHGNGRAK